MLASRDDPLRIEPRRVCIIKPSALGDIVHTLPALAALRGLWPHAHLAWVVNQGLRGLLDGHPQLDEVIAFDRARVLTPRGALGFGRFLKGLRDRRFDVAIDFQGLFRSGLMSWATGAPVRLGASDAREGATRFYTHLAVTSRRAEHAVDRMLALASACGADVSNPEVQLAVNDADRAWARDALRGLPRPILVLNPGARWLTKRWPPEQFAAVARRAVEAYGGSIAAVGAVEDRPLVDALAAAIAPLPLLDLCGRTTLPRLAALAARSDLFLSNDTGPLHLAAAAGANVVGVYTCTSPRLTGPRGPRVADVRSCVWCAPSFVKTCPRLDCMTELTPERVWNVVRARLEAPADLDR
ncbi:MAG: glycosyltransferase family 9 protein [Planctomycetota bacterium]|nr:glycosyltransferase family 9 protein [Planctomycetota bacterium]